jgi:hypothetical protein
MYKSKHLRSDAAAASQSDEPLGELVALKYKYQNTLLNVETVTNEIELVTKFVKDYWNTTGNEKQLALEKLTRIVNDLKRIKFLAGGRVHRPHRERTRMLRDATRE